MGQVLFFADEAPLPPLFVSVPGTALDEVQGAKACAALRKDAAGDARPAARARGGVAHDGRTDLEQPHADRRRCGALEFGALEGELAQPLHQRVGQRGQQQAQLVGREAVAARAGAEQIELGLDAVLGLAPGAVQPLYSCAASPSRLVTTKRGLLP